MNRIKSIIAMIVILLMGSLVLTGCVVGAATPAGMCGWVQGDGTNGNDARVRKIVLPNETAPSISGTVTKYVPCNSRNYIITNGSQKGVNGSVTGDSSTPIVAYTKDKTPVKVALSAFWTLNEGSSAFSNFIAFCQKYNCAQDASSSDTSSTNFGTKGWNGMLAETFYPSIRNAVQDTLPTFSNDVWQNGGNEAIKKQFADAVSTDFMKQVAVRTGYNTDLFCGSGNSRFKVGSSGEFDCTNVRFTVDDIVAQSAATQTQIDTQSQSQLIQKTNQSRFAQSEPLYGKQTNYWLGLQDSVKSCPKGATCNFNVRDPLQN